MRIWGIQQKIVVPYLLLTLAILALIGGLLARERAREIETTLKNRLKPAAVALYSWERHDPLRYLVDGRIGPVFGVDALAVDERGQVLRLPAGTGFTGENELASTLPDEETFALAAHFRRQPVAAIRPSQPEFTPTLVRTEAGDYYCALVDRHRIYLVLSARDVKRAQWEAVRPVLEVGLLGALAAGCFGLLIARTITNPLRRLRDRTGAVARGQLEPLPLPATADEVGDLGRSFNAMVANLRAYQEQLVRTEKMAALGKLAAGVAHEIRNPLSSIKMLVQLERQRSDSGRESLDLVLAEIDRLENTLTDLLSVARPPQINLAPGSPTAVATAAVELVSAKARHLGLTLEYRPAPGAGRELPLDPDRLKQVLLNLLENAFAAAGRGGTVRLTVSDEPDATRLAVRDSGPGVEAAVADRVFEPFFSTREGGAGLGLAVSRTIVAGHGGELSYGRDGDWTVFTVSLPAAAPA